MESLVTPPVPAACAFGGAFSGRRVFVTGHTGFKGAWLCEWLLTLGAEVTGLALAPPTRPSLFEQLGLATRMKDLRGDVRDLATVRQALNEAPPDFVFHLAAQPLVRLSYAEPVATFETNIVGTMNVLEALRGATRPCAVVIVTTDKCYENHGRPHSYTEDEPLGGHDPYSASKAAAEIVVSAYRRSFFSSADSVVRIASARAGNVIGGGDWALDRLVPDCVRSLQRGEAIAVRNPRATRPWQHVLEPLAGYLTLAVQLRTGSAPERIASAFNFGPEPASSQPVRAVVEEVLRHWPGRWEDRSDARAVHEAAVLGLDVARARRLLAWAPVWDFEAAIAHTVQWYRAVDADAAAAPALTRQQIARYVTTARLQAVMWAR